MLRVAQAVRIRWRRHSPTLSSSHKFSFPSLHQNSLRRLIHIVQFGLLIRHVVRALHMSPAIALSQEGFRTNTNRAFALRNRAELAFGLDMLRIDVPIKVSLGRVP